MRALRKTIILAMISLPLIFLMGYGTWIIIKTIDFEQPLFPAKEILYQYINGQEATYNGNALLPSSKTLGMFDSFVSDEITYEYKFDNDSDNYHKINSTYPGPIHAGKYLIKATYTINTSDDEGNVITKSYTIEDVNFEIKKAKPTISTKPTITNTKIIEGRELSFTGGKASVSGKFSLDSSVLFNNGNSSSYSTSSCNVRFKFTPDKIEGYDDYDVVYTEPDNLIVYAVTYNKTKQLYYGTIEKALHAANDSVNDEICVIPELNPIINENCIILSGDTLILAYEFSTTTKTYMWDGRKSGSTFTTGNSTNTFADANVDNMNKYLKSTIEIAPSCSLTVEGTLNIGGILGHESIGLSGFTSGNYTQFVLNQDSQIIMNSNSTLNCLGYIKTTNNIIYNESITPLILNSSSTIYAPFVIYDYRGGSSTVGAYNNSGHSIFPFNVFDLPNVQVYTKILSGAKVYGYVDIYTSQVTKEVTKWGMTAKATIKARHNNATFNIINTTSALLNLTSGYILYKYQSSFASQNNIDYDKYGYTINNTTNGITTLSIYGNINFGNIKFSIDMFDEIEWSGNKLAIAAAKAVLKQLDASFDTATIKFPICWKYRINYESGTFNVNNHIKLLTGTSLIIKNNASIVLNSKSTFISYSKFNDDSSISPRYPSKDAAILQINGTLDSNNGSIAGFITTNNSIGNLKLSNINSLSISSDEGTGGWGISGLSITYSFKQITDGPINESARGYVGGLTETLFEKASYTSQNNYWLKQ